MNFNTPPQKISINEVWKDNDTSEFVFSHTSVVAFIGDTVYHGTTTARKEEIDKDQILRDLTPVPRERIYPTFTTRLTRAPDIYLKGPDVNTYSPDGGDDIALQLLHEAEIYEMLRKHPHPALAQSLGCVVGKDGRITNIMLVKYKSTLFERAHDPSSFGQEQRSHCLQALRAGCQHLHGLGLAHNDISPLNVMFTDAGDPVLLDFDSCQTFGTKLAKGGQIGDWEGLPAAVYKISSAECDMHALEYLESWLKKKYEEMRETIDGTRQKK